nr:unnamed protein product [Callosobruchus analis]
MQRVHLLRPLSHKYEKLALPYASRVICLHIGSGSDTDTSNSDSSTSSPLSQTSSDVDEAKKEGILGEVPIPQKNVGPEITGKLAVRWNSCLSQGVDKKTWKKLLESSSIPDNCTMLQGPMLNCEVPAMLSSAKLKKDF